MPFKKIIPHRTRLNHAVILLTLSDVFTWGLYAILNALAGIYLAMQLGEGVIQVVGTGLAVYSVTRGLLQVPIGKILDSITNDTDEIAALALGNIIMGSSYLFYPLIDTAVFYFILQFWFGVGTAFNLVAWRKLFAKNIDHEKEGLEYGEYGLVMSLSMGIFGIFAGTIANMSSQYFKMVIVGVGMMMIFSSVFALMLYKVKNRNSHIV